MMNPATVSISDLYSAPLAFTASGAERPLAEKQLNYEDAKKLVLTKDLKSRSDYSRYLKENNFPVALPRAPDVKYKNNGWEGWGHFLGTERISFNNIKPMPFNEARDFAHNLKLNSMKEWFELYEKGEIPKSIPKNAQVAKHYKKEWSGVADFLGYDKANDLNVNGMHFKSVYEAAKYFGIKYGTVKARLRRGQSIEASLGIN